MKKPGIICGVYRRSSYEVLSSRPTGILFEDVTKVPSSIARGIRSVAASGMPA